MSTQSGITVSKELQEAFKNINLALVIKVSSDNTELVPDDFHSQASGLSLVFAELNKYIGKDYPQPAYIIISVDDTYAFVSFIPDDAPIRQKMLYASTKNTLLTALGSGHFSKQNVFSWTELDELTYDHYRYALKTTDGPLTNDEKVVNEINNLGNLSLAASHGYKKELPTMHDQQSKLFYKFDDKLEAEVNSLHSSATNRKLFTFDIDVESERLRLTTSEVGVEVESLISSLTAANPTAKPQYSIHNYRDNHFAFIYSCPSGSKVKERMLYATSKLGLISYFNKLLSEHDLSINQSLEVGDLVELDLSKLQAEPESPSEAPVANNGLRFSKPKGPRRR